MAAAPLPPGLNIITAYIDHKYEWEFLIDLADFMRLFREYDKKPFNESIIYTARWGDYVFKAVRKVDEVRV